MPIRAVALASACVALLAAAGPLAAQSIDTLALAAHARALAHDSMGGRAIGSRGGAAAEAYIAAQLRALGLEPAGERGTFFQSIPLVRVDVAPARTRLVVHRAAREVAIPATEFYHLGGDSLAFGRFAGPLLTVAPAPGGLDAAARDPRLRGAVMLARAMTAPLDTLLARAEAGGAAALIVVIPDSMRYLGLRNARGPTRYFVRGERIGGTFATRTPVLMASPAAQAIFAGTADGDRIALEVAATFTPVAARNVVARLPGTDPARRDRHVLYVAHHDHIGHARPVNGDSLYNGFIDNAVGVSAVLAIAKALRARPTPRSHLFLLAGAEEQGSLGSAYWVAHPTVPLPGVVAALNLDSGAPLTPPRSWYLEGGGGTRLERAATEVGRERGWPVQLLPSQPSSDHHSFHVRGIPSAMVVPGDAWEGADSARVESLIARWWRAHRPDDEWSPEFPWAGLARYAEFAMLVGRRLAEER